MVANTPPTALADSFIDGLVADLSPTAPLRPAAGLGRAALALLAACAIATLGLGMRADLAAGQPDPMFLLPAGLLLLLACAATFSVVAMSRPAIGNFQGGWHQTGWFWASAMAALLPASAALTVGLALARGRASGVDRDGWICLAVGVTLGLLVAVMLALWLRRGAPTSPTRAGLLTGIAAGASGMFATTLHCPHNDIAHIGVWHGGAVVVSALAGRWIVPRLIRW